MKNSYNLLSLKEDWDYEGGKPVDLLAFNGAMLLLHNLYFDILTIQNGTFLPEINNVNDGSIDISFNNETFRLLINVKSNGFTSYGDEFENNNKIKTTKYIELIGWLKLMKL